MYVDEHQLLHISIDELKMRNYELKDLLSDDLDSIARQVVSQWNIGRTEKYFFVKVFGLVSGELLILIK